MLRELQIDRASGAPVYRQVEARLLEWIESGELNPGDRLPSLRDLSDSLGITHVTARQAIKGLVNRGVVVARQGQGTFVAQRETTNLDIGLILPNLSMAGSAGISRGACEVSLEHDCHVTVLDSHDNPELEVRNLRRVRDNGCAGAIVFSQMSTSSIREMIQMMLSGYPIVLVDRYLSDMPCFAVHSDNVQGGILATEHLIARGCKRIALVTDLLTSGTRGRYEGYREALGRNGIPFVRELLCDLKLGQDNIREVVRELIESATPPDAIFFGNDLRALTGMQAIKAAGLRIPEDIAVVGFDDLPVSPLSDPPLTTIRQDVVMMGRVAAEMLWTQLGKPVAQRPEPEVRALPVSLIERASA